MAVRTRWKNGEGVWREGRSDSRHFSVTFESAHSKGLGTNKRERARSRKRKDVAMLIPTWWRPRGGSYYGWARSGLRQRLGWEHLVRADISFWNCFSRWDQVCTILLSLFVTEKPSQLDIDNYLFSFDPKPVTKYPRLSQLTLSSPSSISFERRATPSRGSPNSLWERKRMVVQPSSRVIICIPSSATCLFVARPGRE